MAPYAGVALLSAFLLFLVQPLVAKAILPWFGGVPAVWATCVLVFQSLLLIGYAYAHLTRRVPARLRAWLHIGLLALTLVALPIVPDPSWKPTGTESPAWLIFRLLVSTVGAPYVLLSATTPLLQDWFHRQQPNLDPYRLYAWSNVGSLAALLAYPFLVERLLAVDGQAWAWSAGYVVFAAACGGIAFASRASGSAAPDEGTVGVLADLSPAPADRALWFLLSACGSGLLLAITNQLTLDVAAVPFLWVVPMALYLVTFILAFAGWYRRGIALGILTVGLAAIAWSSRQGADATLTLQAASGMLMLFGGCLTCHGELARLAPHGRHLTVFYLLVAAGGAVGGALVAVVAPQLFLDLWELPIFVMAPYLLLFFIYLREPAGASIRRRGLAALMVGAVVWLGIVTIAVPTARRPGRFVDGARSFYGVLKVMDDPPTLWGAMRRLWHGRITHGAQLLAPSMRTQATTYFAQGTGIEIAIRQHPRRQAGLPLAVGVIGLGAGTIAAWGAPGDTMRFFEINPDVVAFASRHFTFLDDSAATVETVTGDARLALEAEMREPSRRNRYDVLAVDAFSSDAVPIHLLTRECGELYWQALKADGVLAVQITNKHFDLAPVVLALARASGKSAVRITRSPGFAVLASTWMLVSGNEAFLKGLQVPGGSRVDFPADPPVAWTDRFSSLVEVVK